jgi:predicted RNase H-like HicB family nuclease
MLNQRMNNEALNLTLTAVFEVAPEGGFTSHFEELPEIFSEGESIEQARANLFDALKEIMEYHRSEARKSKPQDAVREAIQLVAA